MKFILGVLCGAGLLVVAFCAYFLTGMAPVATASEPMPFEKKLAHGALNARIAKEMPKSAAIAADEANYLAGAHVYRENCAVCHGYPGPGKTAIAKGMFPKPPELFNGKGVTDDEPGETYWKVANGIRMTGMPGFKSSLSDTQMWQVSLLVANADKLPASIHAVLTPETAASQPSAAPASATR